MNAKIFTYFACGVLLMQLTTLSVAVPLPKVTIGEILSRDAQTARNYHQAVPLAKTFEVMHISNYDSIVFVGDIMLGRHVERLMKKEGSDYPFRSISLALLGSNPAIVGNFEASVPAVHKPTPNYQLQFSVASSSLTILKEVGFTHLSLANNHSFDHGEAGYLQTLSALEAADLTPFGSQKMVTHKSLTYIDTTNGRIALLGINNSDIGVNYDDIATLLHEAKGESVMQVVYIHWGLEYEPRHSRAQKRLATHMIANGADLIIGHHPHVVQDIDLIDGVPVIYSLGNYIFDQYFSSAVQSGLVVTLDVTGEVPTLTLHPVSSLGTLSQPHLLNNQKQQQFLTMVAKNSHPDLTESIRAGKLHLKPQFATSLKIAMINK